jgi:hypothetical protein
MTITSDSLGFSVGVDFVDCITGKPISYGTIQTSSMREQPWRSTLKQEATYKAFVHSAKKEGVRVTFFRSQSV